MLGIVERSDLRRYCIGLLLTEYLDVSSSRFVRGGSVDSTEMIGNGERKEAKSVSDLVTLAYLGLEGMEGLEGTGGSPRMEEDGKEWRERDSLLVWEVVLDDG